MSKLADSSYLRTQKISINFGHGNTNNKFIMYGDWTEKICK